MIVAKKSLGQNFLRDENVARNIVASLGLQRDDVVVEIGPGSGALTKYLVKETQTVVGVELDQRAAELLTDTFGSSLTLLRQDILQVDLHSLTKPHGKRLRVVGNIPYYITSEILFHLFDQRDAVQDATLMMQKEVAARLTATPRTKDYGILAVATQFHTKPELLFKVSRNSFYPKPNVDSAVVSLAFARELPPCNIGLFTNIVRSTFGKRRKTLRNGLRYMGFGDKQLDSIGFDLTQRPEELTLEQFLNLTSLLEPFKGSVTTHFTE